MFVNAPSSGATHFLSKPPPPVALNVVVEEGVFFGVDGFFTCCEIVGVVGFLISTCVIRPSVFCSMKLLLFGGPFLAALFEETAAAAPYELFVVVFDDDDDDDGVGDIVVPVVLCGVLFCCSRKDEFFIGLEFNDGSKSWFRLVSSSAATILSTKRIAKEAL